VLYDLPVWIIIDETDRYVLQVVKLIYSDNTGCNSDVLHPVALGNKLIDRNGLDGHTCL
jgi:hypothetical protein